MSLTAPAPRVVLDPLDPDPANQSRAMTARYRLQYRNSNLADTQVAPLARVSGLGASKGYVDVPVARGRGEAWLVYRLTPEDALKPESLTLRAWKMAVARRVTKVEIVRDPPRIDHDDDDPTKRRTSLPSPDGVVEVKRRRIVRLGEG